MRHWALLHLSLSIHFICNFLCDRVSVQPASMVLSSQVIANRRTEDIAIQLHFKTYPVCLIMYLPMLTMHTYLTLPHFITDNWCKKSKMCVLGLQCKVRDVACGSENSMTYIYAV